MKFPFYTVIIILFAASTITAQTLTQAFNEPKPGDIQSLVRLDTSLMVPAETLSLVGQNVNWDFSLLKTASDPVVVNFLDTLSVPGATAYTGCNLVQDDYGSYTYLRSVTTPTTRTEVLGLELQGAVVTLTNVGIAAVYPISFGSTYSDNLAGNAVFTGSTLPVTGKISYTADGTGTLTLGDGFVYPNVIRVKSVQTFTATYFFIPVVNVNRTNYDFYSTTSKFPVLSISYQSFSMLGTPSVSASYRGNSNSFTGLTDIASRKTELRSFPNPANGHFEIHGAFGAKTIKVELLDPTGKIVSEQNFEKANDSIVLNLQDIPNGIYFVRLYSEDIRYTTKLIKMQ